MTFEFLSQKYKEAGRFRFDSSFTRLKFNFLLFRKCTRKLWLHFLVQEFLQKPISLSEARIDEKDETFSHLALKLPQLKLSIDVASMLLFSSFLNQTFSLFLSQKLLKSYHLKFAKLKFANKHVSESSSLLFYSFSNKFLTFKTIWTHDSSI